MTGDEEIVLGLFRKLLEESYVDFNSPLDGRLRFLVDGSTQDVTQDEIDAFLRWDEAAGKTLGMDSVTNLVTQLGRQARDDNDTAAREQLTRMAEGGNELAQAELNGLDIRWTTEKPKRQA